MNVLRIIKLKFFYLFNKSILIVFSLISLLIVLLFFIEGNNANLNSSYNEALEMYNYNCYLYLKTIMVFFSVYLFCYSVNTKNDFLIYLLMPLGVSRSKSIICTMILNVLILSVMFLFLFVVYNLIGLVLINKFEFSLNYCLVFFNILFVCLIYGMYSMILMLLIKNNFVIILVVTLFILSNNYFDGITDLNIFDYLFMLLLANVNDSGELYLNIISYIFLLFSTKLAVIYLYVSKDLNF